MKKKIFKWFIVLICCIAASAAVGPYGVPAYKQVIVYVCYSTTGIILYTLNYSGGNNDNLHG